MGWMIWLVCFSAPTSAVPVAQLAQAVTSDPWERAALALAPVDETHSGDNPPAMPPPAEPAPAAEPAIRQPEPAPRAGNTATEETPDPPAPADSHEPSDAERITRLERSLVEDEQHLRAMQAELHSAEQERAHEEFRQLDDEVSRLKAELEKASGDPTSATLTTQQAALVELTTKRDLAAERFDLVLQGRRVLQEQIATHLQKIARDRETLDRLLGRVPPEAVRAAPPPPVGGPESAQASPPGSAAAQRFETSVEATAVSPLAGMVIEGLSGGSHEETASTGPVAKFRPRADSRQLLAARADADRKEAAAVAAEQQARDVATRTDILRREIQQERKLLDNARKRMDNADQMVHRLEDEFHARLLAGADPATVRPMLESITENARVARQARLEARDHALDLDRLQSQLSELQSEEIGALRLADEKRREADSAKRKVEQLNNPFAPRNVLQWTLNHGATIVAIFLAMAGFIWGSRGLQERIVALVSSRSSRGTDEDHRNRARTLVGVFRYAANVVIVTGGTLMVLDEVGISIAPLMGGAAVLGLAVAFGAQTLIKDYFTGFMILLEQQYMVNDVIRVAGVEGQVERITLRVTVLRDMEGRVHFVPHGEITSTTNLTHGWSRALFDIGVSYAQDLDQVIDVLEELANELRNDPEYGPLILEPPTMLGVESFGESAVTVRFFLKTRPLRQWPVKRELLRRIKRRFDELGIEIPFPCRTVHVRAQGAAAPPASLEPPAADSGPAPWISAPAA